MKFYSKGESYFWDIDRFQLFTESEKCIFLSMLTLEHDVWKNVDKTKNGTTAMIYRLLKQLEESLK